MGNCKDCKNWGSSHTYNDEPVIHCIIMWNSVPEENDASLLVEINGYPQYDDVDVMLRTGPMFGCVRFVRKD
jgi:hypothetical protein